MSDPASPGREPASIRYNNPGAMWGGNAISKKWGATKNISLNDGLNQGNTIAVFPDVVHGIAAQFDLWRKGYAGMTLQSAIKKWSGGNSSTAYMSFLEAKTGLHPNDVVSVSVLSSPVGIKLMKAQAQWEAGRPYPATDEDFAQGQSLVFGKTAPNEPSAPPAPTLTPTPTKPNPPNILSTVWDWLRKH